MDYELLALDLDGTLMDSNKNMSDGSRKALIRLLDKGIRLVLASGRSVYGVMPAARELKLDEYGGYVMGFNAGKVVDCRTGNTIADYTLPNEYIEPIYKTLKGVPDTCLLGYGPDRIIIGMKSNQYVEVESKANKMPVIKTDHFPDALPLPQNKLLVCTDPARSEEIVEILRSKFGDVLNIFPSEPQYIEIMPPGIEKGFSLKQLVESLGFKAEQVVACGDSGNDIPMIQYAGLGVAMGNAVPAAKEAADYITLTNDEEGVLHVLKKFFNIDAV